MNNSINNKVTNFPSHVNDDEVLFQLLDSPKQRARREALLRQDRRSRTLNKILSSLTWFSAGIVFLQLLMLL